MLAFLPSKGVVMIWKRVIILFTMGLSFPCLSLATSPASSVVHYDEQHDVLDIKATQASLQNLCSRISDATGVIFDLSPEAEQQISFNSSQKSVEETLKDLVVSTHLGHMFVYATKSGKTRLYQVKTPSANTWFRQTKDGHDNRATSSISYWAKRETSEEIWSGHAQTGILQKQRATHNPWFPSHLQCQASIKV